MSSERNGPGNEAGAEDASEQESWFEPARRLDRAAAANGHSADFGDADTEWASADESDGRHAAEWFLRTGRAGLMPESMTVSSDDGETTGQWRYEAAGAPPWAGDTVQADGEPPPWEYGPWPEPGEMLTRAQGAATGTRDAVPGQPAQPGRLQENRQALAALITGFLPLVVPGIVLGVLGLRRSSVVGAGRSASWAGITLSVVWAVALGFLLFGGGGSSSSGCSVPSTVHAAYTRVMRDFSSGASTPVLATDVRTAARQANNAAAFASALPLRNALFALARDLEQAQSDLASRPPAVPSTLRDQLSADGGALSTVCKS